MWASYELLLKYKFYVESVAEMATTFWEYVMHS